VLHSHLSCIVLCSALPQINYGANKGKAYTEEEDRFIICSIAKLGYGSWDDLKADIRKSWKFR
jgi:SWI/SNF-related matrix-associated actin-dependent regulator of chromatin subfamily A member 5